MKTDPIEQLDHWLRGEFVRINTALEELYFAERIDVICGRPDVDELKRQLLRQGDPLMERLADMAALPVDPHAAYRLLGLIGHYLAACQRHEAFASAQGSGVTRPGDGEGGRRAAWAVSTRIGNALNVVPRFVFAHQALFNEAIGGRYRTFTSLPDEEIFIRFNALGVLAYYRAAEALRGIANIGVSSSVAAYLFDEAERALADVLRSNQDLAKELNVERFFFNIRPYFKTYRVGDTDHRGANAGDFSAINEIDVTLGLCRMDDPFYRAIVREKARHVPPDDQRLLNSLEQRRSLAEAFLSDLDSHGATPQWKANAARFLAVCKAHGAAYAFHHQRLVKAYVEAPSKIAQSAHTAGVTSSGPPLHDVMSMLQRLLELRIARDNEDLARLQHAIN
ncbi:MAG TPA: monodechloroaminopyrrolnitrin synthase PrnB family protein [Vicinamibacterales bacterium]|nr:monodechloroaminopyrrolnitrin synthase PrnB family protein [Vicinamibacterales bacterium]